MNETIQKVKTHFRENKKTYIAFGGGIAFAAITMLLVRDRHAKTRGVSDGLDAVTVRPLSFLSNQKNNIVTVIEREGRGHTGYIVRCLETGDIYTSQNQAANAMGIPASVVSGQITGKFPDADGYHFERLSSVA